MGFEGFDGKQIAIVIGDDTVARVLRGTASFLKRSNGNGDGAERLLRIVLDDEEGRPFVLLHEDRWSGDFWRDTQYGCDYAIDLSNGN